MSSDDPEASSRSLSVDAMRKEGQTNNRPACSLKTSSSGMILVPQPSDDRNDPLNWPSWRKGIILAIWSLAAFSSQATAMTNLQGYFLQAPVYHKAPVEVSYSISLALAGLIIGAMLVVPLGRKFGSCFCLLWSTIALLATSVWSAMMGKPDDYIGFLLSRLFAGIFASVPLILGSSTVLEIFFRHQRGKCLHVLHIPYLLGVVAGPMVSGYVISYREWEFMFWWTVDMNFVVILLILLFLENTEYDRNLDVITAWARPSVNTLPFFKRRLKTYLCASAISRRFTWRQCLNTLVDEIAIGLSPVGLLAGYFQLVDFGFTTMSFVTSILFLGEPVHAGGYGFDSIQIASFAFSQWMGVILAELYGHFLSDRIPLWIHHRNGGDWKPEYRLHCLWVPVSLLPIGLGLFGAALESRLQWVVVAVGSVLIFAAGMSIVPITMTYLCESFTSFVPETSAIMTLYRLVFGLTTPFFITPWTAKVGIGWVFGTGAFLTIPAFGLIALLLWKGPMIRQMSFTRVRGARAVVGGDG